MAVAFTNLSWWLWSGKHQDSGIPNGSSINSSADPNVWESDILRFPLVMQQNIGSSSRRVKRKWHSREERKVDREYDVVLVPSDGGCVSGSESDDSDWSIGWLEPHGPGFPSDDETDNSFAVLVPCYGKDYGRMVDDPRRNLPNGAGNFPDSYSDGKSTSINIYQSYLCAAVKLIFSKPLKFFLEFVREHETCGKLALVSSKYVKCKHSSFGPDSS
ncbi:hypothetical protein TanjilG_17732 [Lupinus angustifolius]|uniref:Uncharacterized protein n=1 Tax=Lupinus angustifolius TaxID=3871 RepID=A0A1J7IND2_LUPAN|nr:hypothetical protein TanjilG_17732 [Lupinus angustifolius]